MHLLTINSTLYMTAAYVCEWCEFVSRMNVFVKSSEKNHSKITLSAKKTAAIIFIFFGIYREEIIPGAHNKEKKKHMHTCG